MLYALCCMDAVWTLGQDYHCLSGFWRASDQGGRLQSGQIDSAAQVEGHRFADPSCSV